MSPSLPPLVQQLQRLIALPSISSGFAELDQSNRPVIDQLAEWLSALGFACEILEVPGTPGKYNLIATLGQGPDGLVLAGHTDTVPYDHGAWKSDPFMLTERGGEFFGLGVADMKGFFPLVLEAVKELKAKDLKAPVIVLATADEETSMEGARALLHAGKPKAKYAIVGEPTGMKPVRTHKGILMESVRIAGQSGHSSDPRYGKSALEAMHEAIAELIALRTELQKEHSDPAFNYPYPSLNLGYIHGGDNANRICACCELHYDLRPLPGMDIDALETRVRDRLKPVACKHGVALTVTRLCPPVAGMAAPADSALVRAAERLTGHAAEAASYTTEAGFFQSLGMEPIVLGPGDIAVAHQPDERLPLDRIQPTVDLLKNLIKEFCLRG
ncbi:MAG: acetylornithine deacetylase [Gammaproteobacteria bacterium]|nr:acetylornithine deacetylase [Gammaproteobacteria bacterium]